MIQEVLGVVTLASAPVVQLLVEKRWQPVAGSISRQRAPPPDAGVP